MASRELAEAALDEADRVELRGEDVPGVGRADLLAQLQRLERRPFGLVQPPPHRGVRAPVPGEEHARLGLAHGDDQ